MDLTDAILALQILCRLTPQGMNIDGDVNNDGRIGIAEAIYVLHAVAGLHNHAPELLPVGDRPLMKNQHSPLRFLPLIVMMIRSRIQLPNSLKELTSTRIREHFRGGRPILKTELMMSRSLSLTVEMDGIQKRSQSR